jgi:hypothetical protein
VDVVEIGSSQLKMGGVYRVKPLGVYAMIDDGELDWKVRSFHKLFVLCCVALLHRFRALALGCWMCMPWLTASWS